MRHFLTLLVLFLVPALAASLPRGNRVTSKALSSSPLEFSAPVVYDKTDIIQAPAGTIVYDSAAGAFFGLTTAGDPSVAGSWLQMGNSTVTGAVTSQGSSERSERASIANAGSASISSQSGTWLSSVTRNSAGNVTLSFQTSPAQWTVAPTCVCVSYNTTNNIRLCTVNSTSTSSTVIQTFDASNVARDVDFNVLCQGAH